MGERVKLHLPTILSVDTLNSIYHFDLTDRVSRGELHDFYELVFVEKGFYYVILDGERVVVPPGSCIVFAPNAFHSGDGTTQATATVSRSTNARDNFLKILILLFSFRYYHLIVDEYSLPKRSLTVTVPVPLDFDS